MQFSGAQVSWGTESLRDQEVSEMLVQVVHGCVCACFRVVACSKKVVISLNVAGSVRRVWWKGGTAF